MTVLITGGAGFIGSHLTQALMRRGDEVIIADNFSTGSRDNIREVDGRLPEVHELDVATEKERLRELIIKADVIFHLAAAVGVELVVNVKQELMQLLEIKVLVQILMVHSVGCFVRIKSRYRFLVFFTITWVENTCAIVKQYVRIGANDFADFIPLFLGHNKRVTEYDKLVFRHIHFENIVHAKVVYNRATQL